MMTMKNKPLECRIQRLLYHRGFLARRNLTIKSYFYPEVVDVTDIDVLGVRFSDNFDPEVTICECKSGRTNSTVDRIIWLMGLSEYFSASNSIFVRKSIKAKIKSFANEVGVVPVDFKKLEELEEQIEISESWVGSFDYKYYDQRMPRYYKAVKENTRISRVYWFLRSRFWYTDNSTRLKQLITALEVISKSPLTEVHSWLLFESTILLSIAILWLCHETYSFNSKERSEYIENVLTTGVGSREVTKRILDSTYGVIVALMKEKGVEPSIPDYDLLRLEPPEYSKPLIGLVERLNQRPMKSVQIPRFLDIICYEYLLKGKEIERSKTEEIFPSHIDLIAKLSKNVVKFIIDQKQIPEKKFEGLMSF